MRTRLVRGRAHRARRVPGQLARGIGRVHRDRRRHAPIPATRLVLDKAKLRLEDMDVVEINEAFASVVLAWERELHPDMDRVNPNGGAIAIGHPTGCSGARLMATMLNELERTGGRYGLQTMCEGGGQANATIVERLG